MIAAGQSESLNNRLARLAANIGALRKWRRRGLSLCAGLATALALAPFYALPLMALGFSTLILLLDGAARDARPVRSAAFIGWWFGFGYFLLGVYWMAFSFFVQADQFAWMAPFAVLGMPSFLALFSAGACALSIALWREGWRRVLIFTAAWMIFEYLRGHILTGLPWNLAGQALAGTAIGAQSAAYWGAYGLSFIALLLSAAPAASIARGAATPKGAAIAIAAAGALFAAGALRIALLPNDVHEHAYIRIVQPNIPQREKINGDLWWKNFERHLALSAEINRSDARVFVIWPENGVPILDEVSDALSVLSKALPNNAILIAGSVRRDKDQSGKQHYYNSIAIIAQTPAGRRAVAHYDKHHLVPFGEYLPLQKLLRAIGLAQLAPFEDGFTKGEGPRTLSAGGPSFAPLICYEAIFPGQMYPRGKRPQWLLTVTNDAWFGDSSGPRQHLDQARLRSIETGLPMARAANTGVSALIDGRGVYVSRVALYQAGTIDAALPMALAPTLYTRFGDLIFGLMVVSAGALGRLWRK